MREDPLPRALEFRSSSPAAVAAVKRILAGEGSKVREVQVVGVDEYPSVCPAGPKVSEARVGVRFRRSPPRALRSPSYFVLVLVLDRLDSPPAEGYDRAATQACLRVSGHRVSRIPVGGGAFTFDGLSVGRGEGVNLYFAASESQAAEAAQLDSQTLARRRNVVFYPDTNVGMIDPRILACLPE